MAHDASTLFLNNLAAHLTQNAAFAELVARHVAQQLGGSRPPLSPASSSPLGSPPKRGPGRPPTRTTTGGKGGSNVERVLDAIRAGAWTKQDICARADVSNSQYVYSIKTLRESGRIRIEGTRRTAKIIAV